MFKAECLYVRRSMNSCRQVFMLVLVPEHFVEVLFICSQRVLLSLCQIHHLRPKAKRAQSSYMSTFSWFSFLDFCWLVCFYCVHAVALSYHRGHMRLNYLWCGTTRNLHLFEFQDFSTKEIPGRTFCNLISVKCSSCCSFCCCCCCCCCYYYYYYYYYYQYYYCYSSSCFSFFFFFFFILNGKKEFRLFHARECG